MKYNAVGNFFFQYRGQIPLVFLILVTVISISTDLQITQAPYYPWIISLAGVIVSTGEILRIITLGYTATHSSGRNRSHQVAEELNTKGMYSIVQHPLYLANMLLWIGVALISNQWAFVLGSLVLSGILFPAIIHQESAFLKKKFGEEYRQWQKKTPVIFPKPWLWKSPRLPFQWIRLFATEYPTWVSICAGTFLSLFMANYRIYGNLEFKLEHGICCCFALLIGFLGRFFKYIVVRKWFKMPI